MRKLKKDRNTTNIRIVLGVAICLLCIMTAGYAAFSTNIVLNGKGNIKEKSRVIQSWAADANTDFHNSEYRENILSITFLDTAKVPNNEVQSWDVSAAKDKGVMAYVTINEEDNTKYDLYIGAKDGVIANENSSYLFYNFTNTKNIEFKNNFDTSNATTIARMFTGCTNLIELDLSSFNTSNVINIGAIFYNCNNLKTVNLSSFNTNNVTYMNAMFQNCYNLTKLDLSNFNTSKVTTTHSMFNHCDSLTELDVSSFDTRLVEDIAYMFANCPNLTTVYASNSFITISVTESVYTFGASSKIIGQNGTAYDVNHTDKEYARIDTASTPGYFTLKTE